MDSSRDSEVEKLKEEVALLKQQLALLTRMLHGSKSEKGIPDHPDQPDLFEDADFGVAHDEKSDDDDEGDSRVKKRTRIKAVRKPRIPDHLPVRETVLEPEQVKANPDAWIRIGEEHTDRIAFKPGSFFVKRLTRPKYVRKDKAVDEPVPPIIAPLPAQLVDRGVLDASFLAHIVVSKYSDHLPLTRQAKINLERYSVDVSKQTMANGVRTVAEWLRPVVDQMSRTQFGNGYTQIDETPISYLAPGKGKTAQGYLWTVHVPGGDTVYHWYPGRGAECLNEIVPENYGGTIQCDGYSAYPAFQKTRKAVVLGGCFAHVRRKFWEALEQRQDVTFNRWIVGQIQLLYEIEEKLRDSKAGPEKRAVVRQFESRPIIKRLRRALELVEKKRRYLPQSLTGKAISYALNQWDTVVRWIEDGRMEIDNNLVENKIRPTKLGAKNWLFIGANEAGWRSAVIYSIITSCRNHGIEPFEYLSDVLDRLPSMTTDQIKDITPSAWAAQKRDGSAA